MGAYGNGSSYSTYGYSSSGTETTGVSSSSTGVYGYSTDGYGGNFESFNGWAIRASTINGYYAGVFYGEMYASRTLYQASDQNLKENIKPFSGAMEIINNLKPQQYYFKKNEKYAFLNLPKGNHYGLLAQEIEEVLPELVSPPTMR